MAKTRPPGTSLSSIHAIVRALIPFVLLAFAEGIIFFRNPERFFNGDTLFWLWNRHHTFFDFIEGFTKLDPAFWYRPLSQRTIESLLFPFAGLNPIPYRMVGFALFFACTVELFFFVLRLTESRRLAWFTVLVFMPHLVHKFTTYDVAFTPDLFLILFSLGSATAYLRFLRTGDRASLVASALLLAGSLLSKESAVGLPFALLSIWFFAPGERRASPVSLMPHFLILTIYLFLLFGVLHVWNLQIGHVLGWLPQGPSGGYEFGGGTHVVENLRIAFSWIFGIPAGMHGQWIFGAPWIPAMLSSLRTAACVVAILVLFSAQRKFLLLGICWFLAMLAPAVLLKTHFLPYYLSVPLAGIAITGGVLLDWVYAHVAKISPYASMAVAALILAGWTKGQVNPANRLAPSHSMLGGAATASRLALEDVRRVYPALPEGAELILFNEGLPAAVTDHAFGLLFKLAYDDPGLVVRYATMGLPAGIDPGKVFAFKWQQGHFVDVTGSVRQQPALWLP